MLTKLAATLMSKSLRFGGVCSNLHLHPLFIVGLPDNLRDMARQMMVDDHRVAYNELALYNTQLHKMTMLTSGKGVLRSTPATPSVNLVTAPPPKAPAPAADT